MRIISWNVNGIRAAEKRGFVDWMQATGADIVCVQETKAAPDQLSMFLREPEGLYANWCIAERAGYSGVATFSRQQPLDVVRGISNTRFDAEGRVLATHFPEFMLYNVYFPSGTSGPERVSYKLDFYAALLEHLRLDIAAGKRIVLVGDVNTSYAEIDLARPRENRQTSGFMPEERRALGAFFEAGFVDSFRHLYPDTAKYSWWSLRSGARSRNIGWRLDYVLVSANMRGAIVEAEILNDVTGSDHCPVSVTLRLG